MTSIEVSDAVKRFVFKFYNLGNIPPNTDDMHPYAFFISKPLLDDIFKNDLTANGVMCYVGATSDAPPLMEAFVEPFFQNGNLGFQPANYTPPNPAPVYLLNKPTYCPSHCSAAASTRPATYYWMIGR